MPLPNGFAGLFLPFDSLLQALRIIGEPGIDGVVAAQLRFGVKLQCTIGIGFQPPLDAVQQAMLDSNLAKLYGVETKILNQAATRNPGRFSEQFCFRVMREEDRVFEVADFGLKDGREPRKQTLPPQCLHRRRRCYALSRPQ